MIESFESFEFGSGPIFSLGVTSISKLMPSHVLASDQKKVKTTLDPARNLFVGRSA